MTIIGRLAVSAFLFAILTGPAAAAAQVTFTFNQQAPLSPIPKSDGEFQAFLNIQDERNNERRMRLATDFLSDYFDSEFRHLALRLRFQARYALGNWQNTVEAALEGLAAEDVFMNGKLGFVSDPESLPEWPAFQLDRVNQRSVYYQTLTEGYQVLGDRENTLRYGERALDAEAEAWALYEEQNAGGTPEFEEALARHETSRELLTRVMLAIHRNRGDVPNTIEYARRLLDVRPNDVEMLMTIAQLMAQNVPQDAEASGPFLVEAEDYATRAVSAMEQWVASDASESAGDEEKANYLAEAHSNLGMIHFQTGEFAGAADAFAAAAEFIPTDPVLHYRLGVAYNNSQDVDGAARSLACAVFLGFSDARPALEAVYQVKNGSLDGLDAFIQSEGAQLASR